MLRPFSILLFSVLLNIAAGAIAGESGKLPDGRRLQLDKQAVRLLDANGGELARLSVSAKYLDMRSRKGGTLAIVFDTDKQVPLLLNVTDRNITVEHRLPAVSFALERLCLYRDAQQLDHVFLLAKDGLAEQWLIGNANTEPRLFRRLALPPEAKSCHADDAQHLLYVEEKGIGTWAYAIEGEGIPQRKLLGKLLKQAPPRNVNATPDTNVPVMVMASAQTASVARSGDAADDPAIWIHPHDATQSRVIATNKKQGLLSYDLKGEQRQLIEAGRLNNVDVRQNLNLGGAPIDLAVATQRDENALAIFEIAPDGGMRDIARVATDLAEIYGTCLYRTPQGGLEVFANDKDGRFEQYRIARSGNGYAGQLVRSFRVATQPEGCVVDDKNGRLFIGEEKRGIWTLSASAGDKGKPQMILPTGKLLVADVEGLALYYGKSASYLIASSQGNNSYVVLDAAAPYKVRGVFRIGVNMEAGIDGTSETDGLEASSVDFGGVYGNGMLVVQDGYKRLPDGAQNFKYVAWRDIAHALKLEGE